MNKLIFRWKKSKHNQLSIISTDYVSQVRQPLQFLSALFFSPGLKLRRVRSIGQCAKLLRLGIANRITSETTMNVHSSRSHSVFTVYLTQTYRDNNTGAINERSGKLNMVDLAGSERHGKTGTYISVQPPEPVYDRDLLDLGYAREYRVFILSK